MPFQFLLHKNKSAAENIHFPEANAALFSNFNSRLVCISCKVSAKRLRKAENF